MDNTTNMENLGKFCISTLNQSQFECYTNQYNVESKNHGITTLKSLSIRSWK